MVSSIKNAGFNHCVDEIIYRLSHQQNTEYPSVLGIRARIPADDYNLFRLYNSSTPLNVRTTVGMTFDQWRHSRERPKKSAEFVLEVDGQIAGWLRTIRSKRSSIFEMAVSPEHSGGNKTLLEFAMSQLQSSPSISCLVKNYQFALQSLLIENGFVLDQKFVTLIRTIVASQSILERRHAITVASF